MYHPKAPGPDLTFSMKNEFIERESGTNYRKKGRAVPLRYSLLVVK
jgi:hypothetical protein